MYEDALGRIGFSENEVTDLMAQYDRTSVDDLRLSVGLRYFLNQAERLPDLVLSLEAISYGLQREGNTLLQLQSAFQFYLSNTEKISLLQKWAFSPQYSLGGTSEEYKHLMKDDQQQDIQWHNDKDDPYIHYDDKCYTGENWYCQCEDWLKDHEDKIDLYLDKLVEKFYAMRCAMYHNAFPIFIADRVEVYEQVTSYEVYMHGSGKLESFMTDNTFLDMKAIFQKIIMKMIIDVKNIQR